MPPLGTDLEEGWLSGVAWSILSPGGDGGARGTSLRLWQEMMPAQTKEHIEAVSQRYCSKLIKSLRDCGSRWKGLTFY